MSGINLFPVTSLIKLWICVTFLVQYFLWGTLQTIHAAWLSLMVLACWTPASLIVGRKKSTFCFFLGGTFEIECMFMFNKIFFYCSLWIECVQQSWKYKKKYKKLLWNYFTYIFKYITAFLSDHSLQASTCVLVYFVYLYHYFTITLPYH